MLERLGYRVTCRTSGLEALKVLKEEPGGFDLIITDQTMPKLTGLDLTKEILNIRPDIPVIMCTGFSAQVSPRTAGGLGVKRLLMKPLVVREVAKAIREVLDNE
jgi:CheY-like chemotaxis protein